MSEKQSSIEVFYAYARVKRDEIECQKLEMHLNTLWRNQEITLLSKQTIIPGEHHVEAIEEQMKRAQIILLLISPEFVQKEYRAIQLALIHNKARGAYIIPILLRPSALEGTPFAAFEPLPSNHKPIIRWTDRDEAWVNVVQGVRRVIDKVRENKSIGLERPATVFLSYAPEEAKAVSDLQLRLKMRGLSCVPESDDFLSTRLTEGETISAIEHDIDTLILFLTPASLIEETIWRIAIPAAFRRKASDAHFPIITILQGISLDVLSQWCLSHNLTDLSHFPNMALTADASQHVRNTIAKHILQAALTQRWRRIKMNRSYEPSLTLDTFNSHSSLSMERLDLNLNWLELIREKETLPTMQQWEHILLPALRDIKQLLGKKVESRHIHIFIKSLLPVGIALGFAFRRVAGITLLLERESDTWSTKAIPTEKDPLSHTTISHDQSDQDIAIVEVATTRSTEAAVAETLSEHAITPGHHIRLALEPSKMSGTAVRDEAHAQAIALQVSRACQELCDQKRIKSIHLFVAVPLELAVLIGYNLNALCPITLYEYRGHLQRYQPVGTIRTDLL